MGIFGKSKPNAGKIRSTRAGRVLDDAKRDVDRKEGSQAAREEERRQEVNPRYAVAGRDIEPGMTVILAPGEDQFVVKSVDPFLSTPTWLYVFKEGGGAGIAKANEWYAQVDR